MNTYNKLRELGFYSLAAYYKTRDMFEQEKPLNIARMHLLTHGTLGYISCGEIDNAVSLLDVMHDWAHSFLVMLDRWSKETIENPASWRFYSMWHTQKDIVTLNPDKDKRQKAKLWFARIATMNPDTAISKRAHSMLKLIERRENS